MEAIQIVDAWRLSYERPHVGGPTAFYRHEGLALGTLDAVHAGLLADVRRALDHSQEAVAAFVGVAQASLARWESGQRRPDPEHCLGLDAYFGAAAYLLAGTPEREPDRRSFEKWVADGQTIFKDEKALLHTAAETLRLGSRASELAKLAEAQQDRELTDRELIGRVQAMLNILAG